MDYFDIPLEDTIAVGDSTNDLPMLEYAGLSIGMKKSDAPVLNTVDYVTDTVENDGIYKAMKHFELIWWIILLQCGFVQHHQICIHKTEAVADKLIYFIQKTYPH